MTKIEELRAQLVERATAWEARSNELREQARDAEQEHAVAQECLRVHDDTVALMTQGSTDATPVAAPASDRQRRSIVAEVEGFIEGMAYSVNDLVSLVGNVRAAQVEFALAKLQKKNKAWVDEGLWRAGAEPVPHVPIGANRTPPLPPESLCDLPVQDAANG